VCAYFCAHHHPNRSEFQGYFLAVTPVFTFLDWIPCSLDTLAIHFDASCTPPRLTVAQQLCFYVEATPERNQSGGCLKTDMDL
jgi:hypothetical protein